MASFEKRNGSWRVTVSHKRQRRSATFDTKREAREWAFNMESELRDEVIHGPSITVEDAIDRFLREISPKRSSYRWEKLRFFQYLEEPWAQLKVNDPMLKRELLQFRDRRLKSVQPTTVRREFSMLGSLFTACVDWGYLESNPLRSIKWPEKGQHRDRRIFDDEEQEILETLGWFDDAPVIHKKHELSVAFQLALETGMRKGEIINLVRDRIHLDKKYVQLVNTKNGDSRQVPLSSRAQALVKVMIDRLPPGEDRLFSLKEEPMSALWRKYMRQMGITDLKFHDTRHEACTRLAQKLSVVDLARMMGHRDPRSLMVYYNATATEIADRLG